MQSFIPPTRTLMGPGPSDVHPRILNAMARATIGHLDPAFIDMMDEVKEMRSEEHTSELQSRRNLVCRLLLEKKKKKHNI